MPCIRARVSLRTASGPHSKPGLIACMRARCKRGHRTLRASSPMPTVKPVVLLVQCAEGKDAVGRKLNRHPAIHRDRRTGTHQRGRLGRLG